MLPLLEARLCTRQQRDMVWRSLRAMPLRLLERVLPWLAGQTKPTMPPLSHLIFFTLPQPIWRDDGRLKIALQAVPLRPL